MKYATLTKICASISFLSIIFFAKDESLWLIAGFFVFLGFSVLFHRLEEENDEVKMLRYEMHNLVFGSAEEKEEAKSYAVEKKLLLDWAKGEIIKKYQPELDRMKKSK